MLKKDRSDKTKKDSHFVQYGLMPSLKWSYAPANVKFDTIYSKDYNRTRETVQSISTQNQLDVKINDLENFDLTNFLDSTNGKTMLIVGQSNTVQI